MIFKIFFYYALHLFGFKSNIPIWTDKHRQQFRVWPHLIDYNLHLNNAKYLYLFEKSRINFAIALRWSDLMVKNKISYAVAASEISFIKELPLFKTFTIETSIAGWNTKYLYLNQKIMINSNIYAVSYFKIAFVQKGKIFNTSSLFSLLNLDAKEEKKHPLIEPWNELSKSKQHMKKTIS